MPAICLKAPPSIRTRVEYVKSPNSVPSYRHIGEPLRRWLLDFCARVRLLARFLFPESALATDDGAGVSLICQFAGSPFPSREAEKILGNFPNSGLVKSSRSSSDFNSNGQMIAARKMKIKRNMLRLGYQNENGSQVRPIKIFIYCSDYSFQIMSATVCPAGINGKTCSVYGTTTSST